MPVPVFFLVQSFNLCLLFWWADRRARDRGLNRRLTLDLALAVAAAGLIGGRLLHVVWEAPAYYAEFPWRVFDLASGGFVYFGGAIAAALAALALLRHRREPPAPWFDFFAPLVSLGTAIGRLGCLWAGCCYGKLCDLPWAMRVLDENGAFLPRHPAPLYAALWEAGVLMILLGLEKRPRKPGALFAVWLGLHSLGRFLLEFVRDDFRGPAMGPFSISQVIAALGVAAAAGVLLRPSHSEKPMT